VSHAVACGTGQFKRSKGDPHPQNRCIRQFTQLHLISTIDVTVFVVLQRDSRPGFGDLDRAYHSRRSVAHSLLQIHIQCTPVTSSKPWSVESWEPAPAIRLFYAAVRFGTNPRVFFCANNQTLETREVTLADFGPGSTSFGDLSWARRFF
jgi:hypothetical protein